MRRFFVKNILFVLAINVLVKPVWVFLIDRTVQNKVGPEAYGTYNPLFSLSIIFSIILDFGITNYNSRSIARDPGSLPQLFPAMFSARIALIAVYLVLSSAMGWLLGYRGWELALLGGILLIQSLNALVSFIRSNISALHRFKTDGLLSVTDRLFMVAVCGFLLLYPPTAAAFRIEWFVATQVAGYLVAACVSYYILRRISKVRLKFSLHLPTIWGIMKESAPYALLIFLMSVYNRADATMVERLCQRGKDYAGVWAAAFRLLDMANILGLMFATMLLPIFGRMLARKQAVQPIIKLCVNLLLPTSYAVAVAAVCYRHEIMELLSHANELYADPIMRPQFGNVFAWLMASFPAWCIMYIYSTLLTANGSLKLLSKIAVAGVVFNLSLNFWLIPRYQATGGAMVSFATQTGLALAFMLAAVRTIGLPINSRWVLAHGGYMLLVALLAVGITGYLPLGWGAQLAVFALLSVVLLFVFRFVSLPGIKQLMAQKGESGETERRAV